ncbi:MAG: isocitrate lyase/phosphoenolpyruvate mutase family protein [Hydrogenophaga sp.]|nr:isocitrate lyase/phosphoenolpyruvate mutase family protein [Hydrogenophaga sp.]
MRAPTSVADNVETFRALHRNGCFLMPNAWDAGSARILSAQGFVALGTTSAGIAFARGAPDGAQAIGRSEMMDAIHHIASAVSIPVSADLEAGFGSEPGDVAETVAQAIQAGAVGGNIEDASGDSATGLLELARAMDRIRAARSADARFVLTARTDACLRSGRGALSTAIQRCQAYADAGADCVFVPGLTQAQDIARLVSEVQVPVTVVMGLSASTLTVADLRQAGARRISVGGSLARACLGLLRRASRQMLDEGRFDYAADQIPDAELCDFFTMDDHTARQRSGH